MVDCLTLSKHMTCSLPQMMMRGGDTQKILLRLRRCWLYTMPAVIAAGSAGGTTIVIISSVRSIIFPTRLWTRRLSKSLFKKRSAVFTSFYICLHFTLSTGVKILIYGRVGNGKSVASFMVLPFSKMPNAPAFTMHLQF